jgi:hypothetical protein
MRSLLYSLFGLGAVVASMANVTTAAAQNCPWGCYCQSTWCSCNTHGSGSSCQANDSGCIVYTCAPVKVLGLAPDGSAVRLASLEADPARAEATPLHVRWEYVSRGRSAARDCSGVVVARYLDHRLAAAVRRRQQTISI